MRIVCLAALLALTVSQTAAASTGDKIVDAALFRPLGAIGTFVGGVLFLPASLLAAPAGRDGIDEAWDITVQSQYETTFQRPLGDF